MGRFPSGQRGQTVNLLAFAFDGSNPSLPIPPDAEVAQLVEQHLDMVEVVGSSPIPRIPLDKTTEVKAQRHPAQKNERFLFIQLKHT